MRGRISTVGFEITEVYWLAACVWVGLPATVSRRTAKAEMPFCASCSIVVLLMPTSTGRTYTCTSSAPSKPDPTLKSFELIDSFIVSTCNPLDHFFFSSSVLTRNSIISFFLFLLLHWLFKSLWHFESCDCELVSQSKHSTHQLLQRDSLVASVDLVDQLRHRVDHWWDSLWSIQISNFHAIIPTYLLHDFLRDNFLACTHNSSPWDTSRFVTIHLFISTLSSIWSSIEPKSSWHPGLTYLLDTVQ